ncbi:MAG: beta-mannosidase [Bacteroidia bacterium]
MKISLLKYLILLTLPVVAYSQTVEKSLNGSSWKFRKKNDRSWYVATVPGTVHTDLYNNKLIPDPFFGDNEKQLQWIENENWEYKTRFKISKKELSQSHIELQFDGLDTYAKVYVNDSLVLSADNMFRTWKADVKKYLHKGKNDLYVLFESAVKKGKEEAKKLPYTLPGEEKIFTRKAQYQYGWDWAPRFVTCGIWKNVKLNFWKDARIMTIKNVQKSLTDSLAELEFICQIESDVDKNAYLDITNGNTKDISGQITSKIKLKKGINLYTIYYNIKNPQRWWSNGLGFPFRYGFSISLSYDSRFLDVKRTEIGLRTIELIQEKDSVGSSFYFRLNGIPVFMKGANYVPPDNFLHRIKKEDYERIIKNAADANMNMLRVWGGGVYADDEFYEQCDEQGILVWQDFMFACAMYPADEHFMENVADEVIDQVERLRNHPCLALWCGNNEVDEGWKNWDWQKQYHYSEKDSTIIDQNNTILFKDFIGDLVNEYDGTRSYWPSSPLIGWGHKESLQKGDSHYWGVWWGMEPFENYAKKVGRFVSEYGFQGMPDKTTFSKMGVTEFNDHHTSITDSAILFSHQKNSSGYKTIQTYMERDYNVPKSFENYMYVSQLLQAEGMKIAIEAQRRAKPYCMGTLYWQLNDCWPVTSWSSVDYNNNWKASYYEAKRAYQDLIISVEEQKENCQIYIVSDLLENKDDELVIRLFDLNGKVLWSDQVPVTIKGSTSQPYYKFDKSILKKFDTRNMVLRCSLKHAWEINTFYYFVKPKDLLLTKSVVEITHDVCEQQQCFAISSDVLMKNVSVSIEGESINLSDNYFDLMPGEPKTIYLPRHMHIKNLEKKIKITSLVDTY